MIDNSTFVALNIIENGDKILNKEHPLIYFFDGTHDLENLFKDEDFISFLKNIINESNFTNSKIILSYTLYDEDNEMFYNNKGYRINEIYKGTELEIDKKLLRYILEYLYKCSFKGYPKSDISNKQIFEDLKNKYPKKINPQLINNYIESKSSEDFPELSLDIINSAKNIFNEDIKK